jgi:hypothetical protein
VRSRSAVVGAVTLLALAGCHSGGAKSGAESLPPVKLVEQPAASAGGACILWDYDFIRQTIGVTFDVAAADQVDDTSTCVVQTVQGDYPNLMLSVVDSTPANAKQFLADLKPAKATTLKGLGQAGYRLTGGSTADHGPTIEISWLSEASQLQSLTFTFAKAPQLSQVTAMNTKLFALAKAMDTTNG